MTKVAVGIIERKNMDNVCEYLLVSSKHDFGRYFGYYYPPGGHTEANEEPETALIREIYEELGVNVIFQEFIIETDSDVKDQITYWFKCEVDSYDFKIDENEISDARFFTQSEMNNINIWPATKSFFEKYIFNK
ncbi:MAG: NUDIX hydrolase [Patescibacteria group bacterium]|nr:NUDIX hydrolase [Patescibacteria group bacterium]